ncbi:MAG: hypothetical protein KBD56_05005 [Candidatus Eisenbacteria bacterium]|nr:hypothetical protein [Candidatus Eisenbacteria bacterium]
MIPWLLLRTRDANATLTGTVTAIDHNRISVRTPSGIRTFSINEQTPGVVSVEIGDLAAIDHRGGYVANVDELRSRLRSGSAGEMQASTERRGMASAGRSSSPATQGERFTSSRESQAVA